MRQRTPDRPEVSTPPRWRTVVDEARGWKQLVSRRRLLALGASDSWIHDRVKAGYLTRVFRGVYVIGNPLLTRDQLELAAVMACGWGSALSHKSAARKHRIPYGTQGPIEVTSPTRHRIPGITVHRCRDAVDWVSVDGVPCTTVRRTLIDLAGVLTPAGLADAVGQARFAKQVSSDERDAVSAAGIGRKGLGELLVLLGTEEELKSELERRFRRLLVKAGVLLPNTNAFITIDGITYEVDCHWPGERACIELDSILHHAKPWQRERDNKRDTKFTLAGYRVIRITWSRLHAEPDEVLRDVRKLLGCGN